MKALIAQGSGEVASSPGCTFIFYWGLEIVKFILKKTRISAGFRFSHAECLLWSILLYDIFVAKIIKNLAKDFCSEDFDVRPSGVGVE